MCRETDARSDGQRERERDRCRIRQTQTHRETDTELDSSRDRQTDTGLDTHTETSRYRDIKRERDCLMPFIDVKNINFPLQLGDYVISVKYQTITDRFRELPSKSFLSFKTYLSCPGFPK